MRPFESLVVFALVLVVLRRVLGVQVSVVGSLVLTVVVWLIVRAWRDDR